MSQIKYVFWDSDNTLIDTFALHWAKHVHVLKAHGIALDDKYKTKIHHNNGAQNWDWLTAELGLRVPQDAYLAQIDEFYAANASKLALLDGIQDALDLFRSKGLKQCVVSNGRRSSALPAHKALGTEKYFEFILCKEDYEGRKPDPVPYLAAMKKMAERTETTISRDECLAIEDDPLGVESAKLAGMRTIFRPTQLVDQSSGFADYIAKNEQDFLSTVHSVIPAKAGIQV